MATLHIVSASPNSGTALQDCLQAARAGATILLIENGVYACRHPDALDALLKVNRNGVHLRVLDPDLQARGLVLRHADVIESVDYAGFVRLVTECDRSVTWA